MEHFKPEVLNDLIYVCATARSGGLAETSLPLLLTRPLVQGHVGGSRRGVDCGKRSLLVDSPVAGPVPPALGVRWVVDALLVRHRTPMSARFRKRQHFHRLSRGGVSRHQYYR